MKCLGFECSLLRYWKLHLFSTYRRQLESLNIKSSGNGNGKPRGNLHPSEDAAIDSREAGLVSEHEFTCRLLLRFMSTEVKETLKTLLSHFLSLCTELPVYCGAVFFWLWLYIVHLFQEGWG